MTKQIKIGGTEYTIQYTPEVADQILNEIIKWMEHPDNYAASCWEGIAQNDNTLINAPDLIGKIVDNYLQPKCVSDEDYTF
jgi:hypothetical protein